jgi:O-antigen/teichoic acid export membrane protein
MILITVLALILFILIGMVLLTISIGGATFIVLFGDVIVCAVFIVWLIKALAKRKKKK